MTATAPLSLTDEQIVEDLEFEPACGEKFLSPTDALVDCPDTAVWFVVFVRPCAPRLVRSALMCEAHHQYAVGDDPWICGGCKDSHPLKVIRTERIR